MDLYSASELAGGSGGPDPPSLGQGHSRDMCKSEEFFFRGGYPLVKFGIADFTAFICWFKCYVF